MNYIIVKGSKNSGKSATIRDVCKRLKPDTIRRVTFYDNDSKALEYISTASDLPDGILLLTVKKKTILAITIAPTEQRKTITSIMESLTLLGLAPDFAIIAMSGLEKLPGYSTILEMEHFGKCIFETKIRRIPSYTFRNTEEWDKRVSYITAITLHNI